MSIAVGKSKPEQMLEASRNNMILFEKFISKELGKHVSSVKVVLQLLDSEYHQTLNGTKPCVFGVPNSSTNNFLNFSTQTYEPDEELHSFRLENSSALIAGSVNIILNNGTLMSAFSIVLSTSKNGESQSYNLTSIYDSDKNIILNIKFDKKMRIREMTLQNFSLDEHPNLKNTITKNIIRPYEANHLEDTLKKMNELSYDEIKPREIRGL
jgi:hypothetical protein